MSQYLVANLALLCLLYIVIMWFRAPKLAAIPVAKPPLPLVEAPLIPWTPERSVIDTPEAFGYDVFTKLFDVETDALIHLSQTGLRVQQAHQEAIAANQTNIQAKASLTAALSIALDPASAAVTLLVDNSGSMRFKPTLVTVELLNHIANALDEHKVSFEILGFTSTAWRGGSSRTRWLATGKVEAPGRLCDLRHIIYKPFDEIWETRKSALGFMFEDDILKENIDGEALVWAYKRLCQQPKERRVLIVISDGAPVDDSTLSVNTPDYLERHLRHVIDEIEWRGVVELSAIGLGHDVSRYYKRSCTIAGPADMADLLSLHLPMLLAPPLLKASPAPATTPPNENTTT
jgi:cobaltochelatase CobT